jgi:hypothetical protein
MNRGLVGLQPFLAGVAHGAQEHTVNSTRDHGMDGTRTSSSPQVDALESTATGLQSEVSEWRGVAEQVG